MPKDIKNLEKEIMEKIDHDKIKMKPKIYFIMGSILTFLGLISTIVISTFLFSLIKFYFRAQGKIAQYKMDLLMENFPWWTLVFAIVGLIVGLWLIKRYDFSYKFKPTQLILIFILLIISAGLIIDMTKLNDILSQRGPMKGMMRNYRQ